MKVYKEIKTHVRFYPKKQ